jgi:hypothetical protein
VIEIINIYQDIIDKVKLRKDELLAKIKADYSKEEQDYVKIK